MTRKAPQRGQNPVNSRPIAPMAVPAPDAAPEAMRPAAAGLWTATSTQTMAGSSSQAISRYPAEPLPWVDSHQMTMTPATTRRAGPTELAAATGAAWAIGCTR